MCIRDSVRMIHGPGCPVCVTPISLIDKAVSLMAVSYTHLDVYKRQGIGYEKEEFDLNSIKKEKDFGYIFLNPKIVSIE